MYTDAVGAIPKCYLSNQSQIWKKKSLTWSEVRSVPRLIFGVCVGSSLVNILSSWDEARCSDGNKEEVQIISSRNSIVSFFNLILHSKSWKKYKKNISLNHYLWIVRPSSLQILVSSFFVYGSLGCLIFFTMVSVCKTRQARLLKNVKEIFL